MIKRLYFLKATLKSNTASRNVYVEFTFTENCNQSYHRWQLLKLVLDFVRSFIFVVDLTTRSRFAIVRIYNEVGVFSSRIVSLKESFPFILRLAVITSKSG